MGSAESAVGRTDAQQLSAFSSKQLVAGTMTCPLSLRLGLPSLAYAAEAAHLHQQSYICIYIIYNIYMYIHIYVYINIYHPYIHI